MKISTAEFQIAMETFGAKNLSNHECSKIIGVYAPCFSVADVVFYHSGTCYVATSGKEVPEAIMNKAMEVFGEKYPGGQNFSHDEIHSVRGLLTLSAMLEEKYSKELIDKLTNKTYQKLMEISSIRTNDESYFKSIRLPKFSKLLEKLIEFNKIVNPFGNSHANLKQPSEYLDEVEFSAGYNEDGDWVALKKGDYYASYDINVDGYWYYEANIPYENGFIAIKHFLLPYNDAKHPNDEIIYIWHQVDKNEKAYEKDAKIIELKIRLKNGMFLQFDNEIPDSPATCEQIDFMSTYLDKVMKEIYDGLIRYVINDEEKVTP